MLTVEPTSSRYELCIDIQTHPPAMSSASTFQTHQFEFDSFVEGCMPIILFLCYQHCLTWLFYMILAYILETRGIVNKFLFSRALSSQTNNEEKHTLSEKGPQETIRHGSYINCI